MKSAKNEEYKCFLPSESDETIAQEQNPGEPAEVLLQNLFLPTKAGKQQCSYRLETYWSYEVCHGKYVRQYHEEKVKGGTQTTEYFLGKYDKPVSFDPEKVPKTRDEVKKKNIDGIQTTYWELVMDGGTACELKPGQGRRTKVHYICNPNAFHNEILSVTETSTCEYEIVILTSALCSSPLYAQKLDSETFGIPCQKIGDAPTGDTECGNTQDSGRVSPWGLLSAGRSRMVEVRILLRKTCQAVPRISTRERKGQEAERRSVCWQMGRNCPSQIRRGQERGEEEHDKG